jgi:putative oxidoreductase
MAYGILVLRLVVGLVFFGHGAQKMFGWWGGPGRQGTAGFFGSLGFRPALAMAIVAATSELAGGLFALGLLTPFAALAMAGVMVVAVGAVHWKNGFWAGKGGYEFNLVLWASAVAVAAAGPGRFSLDRALRIDDNLSGVWWGVGVLGLSLLGGMLVLATREIAPEPEATDAPLAREQAAERERAGAGRVTS